MAKRYGETEIVSVQILRSRDEDGNWYQVVWNGRKSGFLTQDKEQAIRDARDALLHGNRFGTYNTDEENEREMEKAYASLEADD